MYRLIHTFQHYVIFYNEVRECFYECIFKNKIKDLKVTMHSDDCHSKKEV